MPVSLPTKLVRVRPAQGNSGAVNQIDVTVAASQTIKQGDFLSLSGTGKAQQALALPGSAGGSTSSSSTGGNTPMIGVAMADITSDSNGMEAVTGRTTVPVAILDGNLEIVLRVFHATPGSATPGNLTLGNAAYNLVRVRRDTASDWWYGVSSVTPTAGELKFVEFSPESASSDSYGLVVVRPVLSDTVRQL